MDGVPIPSSYSMRFLGWLGGVNGWLCAPNSATNQEGLTPPNNLRGLAIKGDGSLGVKPWERVKEKTLAAGNSPIWGGIHHLDWRSRTGSHITVLASSGGRYQPLSGVPRLWLDDREITHSKQIRGAWVFRGWLIIVAEEDGELCIYKATRAMAEAGEWAFMDSAPMPVNEALAQPFWGRPNGAGAVSYSAGPDGVTLWRVALSVDHAGAVVGSLNPEATGYSALAVAASARTYGGSITARRHYVAESCAADWPCRDVFSWPPGLVGSPSPHIEAVHDGLEPGTAYSFCGGSGMCGVGSEAAGCADPQSGHLWEASGSYWEQDAAVGQGLQLMGIDYAANGEERIATIQGGGSALSRLDDTLDGDLPLVSTCSNDQWGSTTGDGGYSRIWTNTGEAWIDAHVAGETYRLSTFSPDPAAGVPSIISSGDRRSVEVIDLRIGAYLLQEAGPYDGGDITRSLSLYADGGEVQSWTGPGGEYGISGQRCAAGARNGDTMIGLLRTPVPVALADEVEDVTSAVIIRADGADIGNATITAALGITGDEKTPFPARGR